MSEYRSGPSRLFREHILNTLNRHLGTVCTKAKMREDNNNPSVLHGRDTQSPARQLLPRKRRAAEAIVSGTSASTNSIQYTPFPSSPFPYRD